MCVQTRLIFDLHVKPSDTKRIIFASKVVGGLYMGYIIMDQTRVIQSAIVLFPGYFFLTDNCAMIS